LPAVRGIEPDAATLLAAPALFDATWRAGRVTDLALRMRRHGRLPYTAVEAFGRLVSLPASDLRLWAPPTLRELGIVDYVKSPGGGILEIEERVGVGAGVREQCAAIWQNLAPAPVEACAIASADHYTYAPMALSDHRSVLEAEGFPAELHEKPFERCRLWGSCVGNMPPI
jgi:hypothetical protein